MKIADEDSKVRRQTRERRAVLEARRAQGLRIVPVAMDRDAFARALVTAGYADNGEVPDVAAHASALLADWTCQQLEEGNAVEG